MRMMSTCSALISIGAAASAAAQTAPAFEVGETFPAIVLLDADGSAPRSIADFRGQKIILHMFASW